MNFVKISCLCLLLIGSAAYSQQRVTADFGKPTRQETIMTSYKNAPNFSAVVLFEKEKDYFKVVDNRIKLVKEVHRKIKVFNAKEFKQSTVEIVIRTGKNQSEKIQKLKAITHNGDLQNYVGNDKFYTNEVSPYYSIKTFTFGNVKDGSILEYSYTLLSSNLFALNGWTFQGTLPKIYSELETEIPGNYVYSKVLVGNERLDINTVNLRRNCFSLPGYVKNADCEAGVYAMKDVPPFITEDHMLSPKNYIAKINFELKEQFDHNGYRTKLTKDWNDIDKQFRTEKDIGRQLNASFFKSKIPKSIQSVSNPLEKAKAVYSWIQQYYTWNDKFNFWADVRVKDAYDNKTGSVSEINLSLINALEAVDLDSKIMLLSTRNNGLPTQTYPVLSEFNYLVCFLAIGSNTYVLDASDKFIPFDMLPFRALNLTGRVMDFKKGSYWHDIEPKRKNVSMIRSNLKIDSAGVLRGKVSETWTGYLGISKRGELSQKDPSTYSEREENNKLGIELNDYSIENFETIESPLKESYTLKLDLEEIENTIYFYPFVHQSYYKENPFQLKDRSYPVEFGYPVTITYLMKLDTGSDYRVENLPENKVIALPNASGSLNVVYSENNGIVNIRYNLKITKERFSPDLYEGLKDFFAQVLTVQTKDVIALKKV